MNRTAITAISVSMLLSLPAAAQISFINPVPQQTESSGRLFNAPEEWDIISSCPEYVTAPLTRFSADTDGAEFRVTVAIRGEKAARKYSALIPDKAEGYYIKVSGTGITVMGNDERGAFYGVKSIESMLREGKLEECTIKDWPEVAYRGTVEGFYGTPWSHEARMGQLEFYGRNKMNVYLYGPKDDPYHSVPMWREPYPEKEAEDIKALVQKAKENGVIFYWAIHPGQDIKWDGDDTQKLISKFESMYNLGIRAFAVFFDDISGEGTDAARQAGLLNTINRQFVKEKKDVAPLIMCPTEYNRAWSDDSSGYLKTLGETLDKDIMVMWTGNSVVHCIDRPSVEWINSRIGRKAYIWWNYPVNDFVRDHMLLGPVYGNGLDIAEDISAFVSNPMEHPEASKIALYSIADYTWNMDSYDSGTSWTRALKDILPGQWEQLETIASHSSDLGPNGHAFRRDESVKITPLLERLEGAPAEPAEEDIMALRRECCAIETAADILLASEENPALTEELAPWLLQAKAVAEYGQSVCTMACPPDGRPEDFMTGYMRARALQARMYEIDAEYNDNPYQPGVKIAGLKLLPVINALFSSAVERYNITYGKSLSTMTGFNPDTMETTVEQLSRQPVRTRGKSVSVSPSNEVVTWHEGDHLTIVLKKECRLERITVDLGAVLQAGDFMVETSRDGSEWTSAAMVQEEGSSRYVSGKGLSGASAGYVRITYAGQGDRETYFRNFTIVKE